jgi:transposase-like protein
MLEKRRQYDGDFKVSAVRLLESSDRPLVEVARGLGISGSMLRRWREQIRQKGWGCFSATGRMERAEILRLRRENQDLRRQVEILKKTFGFPERARKRGMKQ